MNPAKAVLAALVASLRVIFSPSELKHAFVSSLAASSALGFAAMFLETLGNDAAATGLVGAVGSFALLRIASRLNRLENPAPIPPPPPQPDTPSPPAKPTDPTGSLPPGSGSTAPPPGWRATETDGLVHYVPVDRHGPSARDLEY